MAKKPGPRKHLRPKPAKKQPKRPKLIFAGQKRVIDKDAPSKKKSTAQKAKFLRQFIDLPFRNTVNFDSRQKKLIDKRYDGTGGGVAFKRLTGAKRVKIAENKAESFENSGYIVVKKKYKIKGKTKTGTYIITRPATTGAKIRPVKGGLVETYKSRKTLKINLTGGSLPALLDHPQKFRESLQKKHKWFFDKHQGMTRYKIIFPAGQGRFEYEDFADLEKYVEKMNEVSRGRISGIGVVVHTIKTKAKG